MSYRRVVHLATSCKVALQCRPIFVDRKQLPHQPLSHSKQIRRIETQYKPPSQTKPALPPSPHSASLHLTHTDPKTGSAQIVDVTPKPSTHRTATATGRIYLSSHAHSLIRANGHKKGDVLTVAKIAGINAAKQTGTLIPLCHPLSLTKIDVGLTLSGDGGEDAGHYVEARATVACHGPTGVEMEALVAVSVACCTVFDMCKAVDKGMRIADVRVVRKSGGRSGDWAVE
ncbi:molybdenum cofactor biosynthesis protein C [Fimicolochytrium jonesii]|uniref:molybdenum cofactor biosynthesis protein C n=1 Tax=Fimicolochytrium jonesii TaxID=1396493 RepID=UPI0022FE810F|nr:molybdenum cofactor biosynthesis protein C [Fimicolochytrium jonesii]KAI8826866.1 molybdenum cofactor biosynthesis protein C [Fimicolochytrium jonesii]